MRHSCIASCAKGFGGPHGPPRQLIHTLPLCTIRARPMVDRLLFPETFADTLAHLWMNKVHRTQLLKERDFPGCARRWIFFVCGAARELVAPVSGVFLNQYFLFEEGTNCGNALSTTSSRTSTRRNPRTLFSQLVNFETEIRLHSAARLVACKGIHRLHGGQDVGKQGVRRIC